MDNLLFIIIDKLGFRQIDLDAGASLHPTISGFAREGTTFTNVFSHGCPTQFAAPAIFTSTYPLDFGGYDDGILGRPQSLFECLQEAGYHTIGFDSGLHLSSIYGYDRGFDDYFELFHIETFWHHAKYLVSYYRDWNAHRADRGFSFEQNACQTIERIYLAIIRYCEAKIEEAERGFGGNARIYRYDFREIRTRLTPHLAEFAQNREAYLDKNLPDILTTSLMGFLGLNRLPARLDNSVLSSFIRQSHVPHFGNSFLKLKLWEPFVSSRFLSDLCGSWLARNSKRPFAMFVHFLDLHEGYFSGHRIQIASNRRLFRSNRSLYRNYDKFFHDLALRYIDQAIDRIKRALQVAGALEQTWVVLAGDHGGIPGEPTSPFRRTGLPGGGFKDDYLHVPLILWHADMERTMDDDSLRGAIDLPATICDIMGIETPASFRGQSMLDPTNKRDFVLAEHTHRGPCDLPNKPIYLCFRSDRHKYIWKEHVYELDVSTTAREELYDLRFDPDETENRIGSQENCTVVSKLRSQALNRYNEIRGEVVQIPPTPEPALASEQLAGTIG